MIARKIHLRISIILYLPTRMSDDRGMNQQLMTVKEFAEVVGWKPSTVRQKIWRRELTYVKVGRSVRLKPETAQRLIESGTVPALERK